MAKIKLHRFHVPTPHLFRNLRGRQLLEPSAIDTNASITTITTPGATELTPDTPSAEQQQVLRRQRHLEPWILLWLSVFLILGGTGGVGLLWLTMLPPLPDCQHISPEAEPTEQLYCAQMAAVSGNLDQLVGAMKVVEGWSENDPLYNQANRMMGEWSQNILTIALKKINQGNLKAAVEIANQIPANSPLYTETQAAIAIWQQEWQRGEAITQKFQNAVQAQKWKQAWQQAESLSQLNFDYWRFSKHDRLIQQLTAEKQGRLILEEARDLAESNNPEDLEGAIAIAGKIKPHTYVKAQAQAERNKWSRALLQMAATLYQRQNFTGAIALSVRVPVDVEAYAEAKDWIRLSRAELAAQKNNLLAYVDALSVVRQINRKSPLYQKAKSRAVLWQSYLHEQTHLEVARAIASFEQPLMLQVAIEQAQQVAPNIPSGIQAKKLISSWRKEIRDIEDLSIMTSAKQMAKPGTIKSLKAAVAQASQISRTGVLWVDAQKTIAQWTKQIQTIEDKPILDMAQVLAQKGEMNAAIQTAQKIRPGRALYSQAQVAVLDWLAQIKLAQDQATLDAANTLADQERLDAAISKASQIQAGSSLYNEATAAIDSWRSQLNPTLSPPQTNITSTDANKKSR